MAREQEIPATDTKAPLPAQAADAAGELSLAELARGVLSRNIRPRVADVRRLAEAVLAVEAHPRKDGKQAKGKRDKSRVGKKSGKKRKLAKIPGKKS